jgi:serine protein kinase
MADLQEQPNNEAFLDRIYIVKVPYCLRVTDEMHIYEKLLANSSLPRRRARRTRCA